MRNARSYSFDGPGGAAAALPPASRYPSIVVPWTYQVSASTAVISGTSWEDLTDDGQDSRLGRQQLQPRMSAVELDVPVNDSPIGEGRR